MATTKYYSARQDEDEMLRQQQAQQQKLREQQLKQQMAQKAQVQKDQLQKQFENQSAAQSQSYDNQIRELQQQLERANKGTSSLAEQSNAKIQDLMRQLETANKQLYTNKTQADQSNAQIQDLQKQLEAAKSNGLHGISDSTKEQMQNLLQGYQANEAVINAQNALNSLQASKPQGYNSKYQAQLDNILQQIQNPQQFKYEFNGDNLFKAYADLYTQKGKQAALDTQGQAAALNGGYGTSYGQMVGQQQYQQNLLPLYDKAMELEQNAYNKYLNNQQNTKDIYNILMNADATDYGRYRDTVGDWENERNYLTDMYNTERNFDYGTYSDLLNNVMNLAGMENKDYWSRQDLEESKRVTDLNEALNRDKLAEEIRQANMGEKLNRDQLAEEIRQANMGNEYNYATLDEKIRQANMDNDYNNAALQEKIRQADMDNAYNTAALQEKIREADLDNAYNQQKLGWQQETDARDYAESVRQYDQKTAYNYVLSILANGQMPSDALLEAAGLTAEDAQKLLAKSSGTGGKKKKEETPEYGKMGDFYYKIGKDGKITIVDKSTIPQDALINENPDKIINNVANAGAETLNSMGLGGLSNVGDALVQSWNNSEIVKNAGNFLSDIGSALADPFGVNKKKNNK